MEIRTATARDAGALSALDKHISADALRESLAGARVLVLCDGEEIAGWLRWSLFWDEIPFLNMLYLLEPHRGRGHGRARGGCAGQGPGYRRRLRTAARRGAPRGIG